MATRFYLSSTAAAPITVAFNKAGVWGLVHASADRRKLLTTKDASAMASVALTITGANPTCTRQYISDPMNAMTLPSAGTMKGQIRVSGTAGSPRLTTLTIYVVSGDGATLRGIYFSNDPFSTDATSTLTNRSMNSTSVPSQGNVTVQNGDRLVIEIGAYSSSNNTFTHSYGSDNATDLPENNTTTAANNPWVELSANITFQTTTTTTTSTTSTTTTSTSTSTTTTTSTTTSAPTSGSNKRVMLMGIG